MAPTTVPESSPPSALPPRGPHSHLSFPEAQILVTTHQVQCQFRIKLSKEIRKQRQQNIGV